MGEEERKETHLLVDNVDPLGEDAFLLLNLLDNLPDSLRELDCQNAHAKKEKTQRRRVVSKNLLAWARETAEGEGERGNERMVNSASFPMLTGLDSSPFMSRISPSTRSCTY